MEGHCNAAASAKTTKLSGLLFFIAPVWALNRCKQKFQRCIYCLMSDKLTLLWGSQRTTSPLPIKVRLQRNGEVLKVKSSFLHFAFVKGTTIALSSDRRQKQGLQQVRRCAAKQVYVILFISELSAAGTRCRLQTEAQHATAPRLKEFLQSFRRPSVIWNRRASTNASALTGLNVSHVSAPASQGAISHQTWPRRFSHASFSCSVPVGHYF